MNEQLVSWFESDFYYPTHLGPFKRAVGALSDWLAAHTSMFEVAQDAGNAGGAPPGPLPQ